MKYYIKGCSRKYQLANIIHPKLSKTRKYKIMLDGEETEAEVNLVSENGTSWYPIETLTTEISDWKPT